MIVRPPAQRPVEFAIGLLNGQLIDACMARIHQTLIVELPIFIAVSAKPVSRVVAVFIGKADRDAVAVKSPKLLNEAIIEFPGPLSSKKRDYLLPPGRKLGAVSPTRIDGVGKRNFLRIASVPAIFGETNFLNCAFLIEWWQRRA